MDTYLFKNIVGNGFRKGPIIKCEKYSQCILTLPTISKIPYIGVALILRPCRKMWVRSATDNKLGVHFCGVHAKIPDTCSVFGLRWSLSHFIVHVLPLLLIMSLYIKHLIEDSIIWRCLTLSSCWDHGWWSWGVAKQTHLSLQCLTI